MREIKSTQVYTREEAELILRISQSTMMRLIKKGVIRAAKIGGQYRILGSELLRQFLPDSEYEKARKVYRKARSKVHAMEKDLSRRGGRS